MTINAFERALARTDGKTLIVSNGSKWAGEAPDSVERLLLVLKTTPLDPTFERYGYYTARTFKPVKHDQEKFKGWLDQPCFAGNFANLSHAFQIITRDEQVAKQLREAIDANLASDEYQREAYEMYADWWYADSAEGVILVSPAEAEAIRSGHICSLQFRSRYSLMKTAKLLGPRFIGEQAQLCA